MDYLELSCKLDPLEPWRDILIAQLADIGFESFEETYDGLKAYIPSALYDESLLEESMRLPEADDNPVLGRELKNIAAINWNEAWESNFEPITVGNHVYIRAPFHPAIESFPYEIIIEPKMSFGTGHHETTRLVIEWMLEAELQGKSVLDMGCGTGILAILASMRGASQVVAIDNFYFAYENTLDNVKRNDCHPIEVWLGDAGLLGGVMFDVILANITRNVLLEDMQKYAEVLNPGGLMILSGFLETDKLLIIDHAISLGLTASGEKKLDDWVGMKLTKSI